MRTAVVPARALSSGCRVRAAAILGMPLAYGVFRLSTRGRQRHAR
ncbi:hypothetical protein PNQ69_09415 [Xanthomonas sp. A2111]|uniref:Uncharacterized protein n=1 Tax=Xanthomonas hawaiiensis TaxID=3003247 RepID=A0ABU2I558_9XANT|nr:hypothetical protein [Xanthomonas sp. A2111]MDS9992990.1 hypothetical protein [Xanthomonas sp. A2111]